MTYTDEIQKISKQIEDLKARIMQSGVDYGVSDVKIPLALLDQVVYGLKHTGSYLEIIREQLSTERVFPKIDCTTLSSNQFKREI